MMKKVCILLMTVLFAGGILFYGSDRLFAAAEEGAAEEVQQENYRETDIEEMEKLIQDEEKEELINPGEGYEVPEEEKIYFPDEK